MPAKLRSSKKGLIIIKNNIQKKNPEKKIHENIKNCLMILVMMVFGFLYQEKVLGKKIEEKNNICIKVFSFENRMAFPIYI